MSNDLLPPLPPPSPDKSKKGKEATAKAKTQQTRNLPSVPPSRMAASAEIIRKMNSFRVVGLFCVSGLCFFLCYCFFLLNHSVTTLQRGSPSEELHRQQGGFRAPSLNLGLLGDVQSCDLFDGEWVWDDQYPLYQSRDCPFLDQGFRCSENGRSDSFYTKWRWQPNHCDLPRFKAKDVLEWLRNKRLVFVGDSLGRNQWESLLCLLSKEVPDKKSIHEVNGNPITKHNGFFRMKFKDYNCTIEYFRAPYLVAQGRAPRVHVPAKVSTTLKLDLMDWTASRWRDADILIFNTGHWWNYEKTIKSGCYFQIGRDVLMNMTVEDAYKRSVETLLYWIKKEVNTTKTQVVYRTYSPVHFRGGDWRTGGSCHMETLPEFDAKQLLDRPWAVMLKTFVNVVSGMSDKHPELHIQLLNITEMTNKRKDGHASLYYLGPGNPVANHRQDCSHWCLPGIPDAWNELLFTLLLHRDNRTAGHSILRQKVER